MDELDSKLKNLEELEAARAKEAWEKHVVSQPVYVLIILEIILDSGIGQWQINQPLQHYLFHL